MNVSHVFTFFYVALAHAFELLRKKLDDRNKRCIFVGYSEPYKAYKLYDLLIIKFLLSKDVNIFENKTLSNQIDEVLNHPFHPPQLAKL